MLLPWLILIPFIGGLLSWQAERIGSQVPRWVALLTMGLTLVISVQLWLQGDYQLISVDGAPRWTEFYFVPWHVIIDGGINCYFRYFSGALFMERKSTITRGFPFQPAVDLSRCYGGILSD